MNKEQITTIRDTRDIESHIIWLMKLEKKQAMAVIKMLLDMHKPNYWEGVNKYSVRSIVETYTERVASNGR